MSRPTWARWVTRISLVVAVVFLAVFIQRTGVATLAHNFKRIGWWWFAVIAIEAAITSMDAVAIRAFLSPDQKLVSMRAALLSQLAGRSVNTVTLGGNLGEAVKVSVLTEHVSNARAVATILLYNVVGFCVELGTVAVAAPLVALLVPMPSGLRTFLLVSSGVSLVACVGLYVLVRRGVVSSFVGLLRELRVISAARFAKWNAAARSVDEKMRLSAGARRRDRITGIAAVIASRLSSTGLSLLILHAVGEPITVRFIAAYVVGGFIIYMVSTLVPMGLGITDAGNWELFRALGDDPKRGTTLAMARRATLVVYVAIGIVLVAASETVKRAREARSAGAPELPPEPVAAIPVAAIPPAHVIDAAD